MSHTRISTNEANLQAALALVAKGFRVIPVRLVNGHKKPAIKGWQAAATSEPATIRRWWRQFSGVVPGLPTGASNGFVVIDPDVKNGKDGLAAMRALGLDPDTLSPVSVESPTGGRHLYFEWSEGMGNSAKGLPDGIDVRGEGGFVVAPGSVTPSGTYKLLGAPLGAPLPPLPAVLRPASRSHREAQKAEPSGLPLPVILDALGAIPNDDLGRDEWVRLGAALHAETGGSEEGREAFHGWSEQHPTYDAQDTDFAWDSFRADREGGATGWTIIHEAEARGWSDPAVVELRRIERWEQAQRDFDELAEDEEWPRTEEDKAWFRQFVGPLPEDSPTPAADELAFSPASSLSGLPVPPREWLVRDLIPAGDLTMLNGDGGTGKSLLALQLAVSTAIGRCWIGQNVLVAGKAMVLTAEDDMPELHRRLAAICEGEELALEDLTDLRLLSLAGQDALLAVPDKKTGSMKATALFQTLDEALERERPSLLVLDTLADLHSGEENARVVARSVSQMLRRLALKHGVTVLLLAHPSLTGMSSGSGLSGNTAWSNSVRSRLYLKRIVGADGEEPHPDARVLTTMKANYSATGGEVHLRWRAGRFISDHDDFDWESSVRAETVFLRLLDKFTSQKRHVSANPGKTYAPDLFAVHPNSEGCTKAALKSAMDSLLSAGTIFPENHGTEAKPRFHLERAKP